MIRIICSVSLLLIFLSCKKQQLLPLEERLTFVHFNVPQVNAGSISKRLDSLDFSFAHEAAAMKTKIIAIPLSLVGQKQSFNRAIHVTVDEFETNIDLDLVEIQKPMIGADRFTDTLFVKIAREPSMKQKIYNLTLRISNNEFFSEGQMEKSKIKILISDQLLKPYWWQNWGQFFGDYYPEVYQQWIKIYKIGLDKSVPMNIGDQPNFAWNNMPAFPIQIQYPITFFYLSELKEYFEKNVIYPNNDSSKSRIKLP
ncbi:DUF4843 domain-containing protein [Sphingobacterium sp. DK4209]|uniref:DUF4843 domain-containing protein n=1 Tax=Sphingobacterium zhuxiongii TaxID=2662364 RepID=A0A5Q0QEA5_9SPHI|nr:MULTISPECIES: DUF4843 domain-containing protein [unclassified Sphingobacterium]MVZ65708.1 DUF4843 domain-containing protein [Sphingobacterium sp. DK4209]QGA27906.1 DUF4843 domain-containing protein [Sphingobacterium sp. dk4302]